MVRLRPSERAEIEVAASLLDVTLSEFAREALFRRVREVHPEPVAVAPTPFSERRHAEDEAEG